MKSFVLLWSSWSYLECQEFILLWHTWNVLYCYGLPGLLWNVDSFILLWPAWFHVEWERFHPVSLEVVELWSSCYSVKLGEL